MAIPTKKNPIIEDLINSLNPSGRKRVDSIQSNICTWCGKSITGFKDALSAKEYTISGFCQACQDKTFNNPDDEEYLDD